MLLKVLKPFIDKHTKETYEVGQEIEVTEKRGFEIIYSPILGPSFVEPILDVTTETISYADGEKVTTGIDGEEIEEELDPEHYPLSKGGGYYILSNGDTVKGKEAAIKAEAALQEQE